MTTLTTTPDVAGILPGDYGPLIIQPVEAESAAFRAATIFTTGAETFHVPVITDDAGASWVEEGSEIPLDDATFAELEVRPAKAAGLTSVSRELAEDSSPAAGTIVGQSIARSLARTIDLAFFGALAAPAPSGLAALTGVSAVDAPAAFTDLDPFAQAIADAEQVGATLTSFVANPADALSLSTLKEETGSNRALLGADATQATDRRILGVPLLVSPAVAVGTVWGIPNARVLVVRRTDVRIETSPHLYFSSDRVAVRATMRVGFAFPHPAAVVKITAAAPAA